MDTILIVGCGPGSPAYLTGAACAAVAEAEVLVGSERLLELFPMYDGEIVRLGADLDETLMTMDERRRSKRVAVLVSGDPGAYSFARNVLDYFGREACKVIPAVSALQLACARLGLSWTEARIVSVHGRETDLGAAELACEELVLVLSGGAKSLPWVRATLKELYGTHEAWLCRDLSLATEAVVRVDGWSDDETLGAACAILVLQRKETA